jgi:hypothetical protein
MRCKPRRAGEGTLGVVLMSGLASAYVSNADNGRLSFNPLGTDTHFYLSRDDSLAPFHQ